MNRSLSTHLSCETSSSHWRLVYLLHLLVRNRSINLSITHKFFTDFDAQVDIGQA